jgi:amino acid transporter
VANTALINMLMASRLLYGLANQDVLPRTLGKVLPNRRTPWAGILFSTVLALGLIILVTFAAETEVIGALAGTTALLLLLVFAVVNVAVLVVRRNADEDGAFTAPAWTPYVGAVACLYLAGPWARDSDDWIQYRIAGILLGIGIVLWVITWFTNRAIRAQSTGFRDIDHLEE